MSQSACRVLVIRKVNSIYIQSEKGILDAREVDGNYDTVGLTWGERMSRVVGTLYCQRYGSMSPVEMDVEWMSCRRLVTTSKFQGTHVGNTNVCEPPEVTKISQQVTYVVGFGFKRIFPKNKQTKFGYWVEQMRTCCSTPTVAKF